jgi:hypothetical protein
MGNLVWKTDVKEGAYAGQKVFDHASNSSVNGGYTGGSIGSQGGGGSSHYVTSSSSSYSSPAGRKTREVLQDSGNNIVDGRNVDDRNYYSSSIISNNNNNNKSYNNNSNSSSNNNIRKSKNLAVYAPQLAGGYIDDNGVIPVNVRVTRPTYDPTAQPSDIFSKPRVSISYTDEAGDDSDGPYEYNGSHQPMRRRSDHANTSGGHNYSSQPSPEDILLEETRKYNQNMQKQQQQQQQQQQHHHNDGNILRYNSNQIRDGSLTAIQQSPEAPSNQLREAKNRGTRPW